VQIFCAMGASKLLMFVVTSKFTVANGMAAEVRQAFLQRPHLVDGAPGFVRIEVWNAHEQRDEFFLVTYWADEGSFQHWHRNHRHASHAGIPKGLKLVPGSAQVRFFDQFCD